MRRRRIGRIVFVATALAPFRAEGYRDLVAGLAELVRDLWHVLVVSWWIVARVCALLTWPISAALLYWLVCRLRARQLEAKRQARSVERARRKRARDDRPYIPQPKPFRRGKRIGRRGTASEF